MTAGASTTGEVDVSARVNSQTVVLVLDVGVRNIDASGAADIECISVMTTIGNIASGVVDGDVVESEFLCAVDGETLNRRVLDVQSGDRGRGQGVSVEELTSQ